MSEILEANQEAAQERQKEATVQGDVQKVAKEAGVAFIGSLVGGGLRYVMAIIIARFIGVSQFGLYSLGLVILELISSLPAMGFGSGVVKHVSKYTALQDKARIKGVIVDSIRISSAIAVFLALALFSLTPWISNSLFNKPRLTPVLQILSIYLVLVVLSYILSAFFQAFKTLKYMVYVNQLFQPLLQIGAFIIFIIAGLKLRAALYSTIIAFLIGNLIAFWFIKKLFPPLSDKRIRPIRETRELIKYSSSVMLVGAARTIYSRIEIIFLGYFLASADVGLYGVAKKTAFLSGLLLASFNSIFPSMASELYTKGDIRKLSGLLKTTTKWTVALSLPIFIILAFYSKSVLLIFGQDFTPAASTLVLLALAQILASSTGSVGAILLMTGNERKELYNLIGTLILDVFLCIWLIPLYGIFGAAIAALTAAVFLNIARLIEVYLNIGIHPYDLRFLKPILSAVMSLAIVALIFRGFPTSLINSVITFLLMMSFYTLFLFIFRFDDEDTMVFEAVRSKSIRILNRKNQ